jgi:hypothetical protein
MFHRALLQNSGRPSRVSLHSGAVQSIQRSVHWTLAADRLPGRHLIADGEMADLKEMRRRSEAQALEALTRYVASRQRTLDLARKMDPASRFAQDATRLLEKAREDYAAFARSIGIAVEEEGRRDDHETPVVVAPDTTAPHQGSDAVHEEQAVVAEPIASNAVTAVEASSGEARDHETPQAVVLAAPDPGPADQGDDSVRAEQIVVAEEVAPVAHLADEHSSSSEVNHHETPGVVEPATFAPGLADQGNDTVHTERTVVVEEVAPVADMADEPASSGEAADHEAPGAVAPAASEPDLADQPGATVPREQAVAAEPIADSVEQRASFGEVDDRPAGASPGPPESREAADDKFIAALMQTASELSAAPPAPAQASRPRLFGRASGIASQPQTIPDAASAPNEPIRPKSSTHPLLTDPQFDAFDPWDEEEGPGERRRDRSKPGV